MRRPARWFPLRQCEQAWGLHSKICPPECWAQAVRTTVDGAFMMHGRKCALCQQGQQACSSLGPLLGPVSGCYVHRQCAIWSPEVGASLLCLTHGDFQG